jgi:hypothetical protein
MFQDLKRDNGSGPPTRDAWNELASRLESLVVSPGPGLFMRRTPTGTVLWGARGRKAPHDRGRFVVTFSAKSQRLYVSEGSVVTGPDPDDEKLRGIMPTLSETPLDQSPQPFFDVSGLEPGEYDVVCSFKGDKAQIFVMQEDEVILGNEGEGEGGEDDNESPSSWVLSEVTFEAAEEDKLAATIKPIWLSDIAWQHEESSSSGSESSESGPGSSAPSDESDESQPPSDGDDGSSKDSAIVPAAWSKTGYVALYTVEAPDVRFEEVMEIRLRGKATRRKIDPRYVAVCEPNTLRACSVTVDQPVAVGVSVEGDQVTVRVAEAGIATRAVVKLTGIRRGFLGTRFGEKTREQFEANERRLKGT